MMATTHALAGLAVGALVSLVAPEQAPVALTAGLLGGAFPDLDLYAGHRRTLHFPSYYPLAAGPAVGLAVVAVHPVLTFAAVFLVAAALHARTDVLGGGLELRPWEATSERGVFDHRRGVWIAPRRWVPYDGAPEDLAVAVGLGVPLLVVLDAPWSTVVAVLLALSWVYAVLRKPLVRFAEEIVGLLPGPVLGYVPQRFLVGLGPGADATAIPVDRPEAD